MKATTFAITTLLLTIGMSVAEPPFQSGSKDTGKPPSKELDEKPGNQDLGGNSGKEPGVGNGDGKGSGCGVGYGVGAFSGKCSNRKLIVRDDTTKLTRGHSSESGKPMKAKDVLDEQRRLEALLEKHKSRTRMLGKDLDNKPGNQNLGGNSGKEPGVGNGKGQGQANGNGFGVASSPPTLSPSSSPTSAPTAAPHRAGKSGGFGSRKYRRNRNRRLEMML